MNLSRISPETRDRSG